MATAIRLKRMGRANDPCFRVVVIDSRKKRDGRETEVIGWYDPKAKDASKQVMIDRERARHWLQCGAQPTETVRNLFRRLEII